LELLLKLGQLSVLPLLVDSNPLDLGRSVENLKLLLGKDGVSAVDDALLGRFLGRADGVRCLGEVLVSDAFGGIELSL
jgi:hypothetical protein